MEENAQMLEIPSTVNALLVIKENDVRIKVLKGCSIYYYACIYLQKSSAVESKVLLERRYMGRGLNQGSSGGMLRPRKSLRFQSLGRAFFLRGIFKNLRWHNALYNFFTPLVLKRRLLCMQSQVVSCRRLRHADTVDQDLNSSHYMAWRSICKRSQNAAF